MDYVVARRLIVRARVRVRPVLGETNPVGAKGQQEAGCAGALGRHPRHSRRAEALRRHADADAGDATENLATIQAGRLKVTGRQVASTLWLKTMR